MKKISKPDRAAFAADEPLLATLLPDDGQLLEHMVANFQDTKKLLLSLPEDKLLHRYDLGKWTIKEVIIHLIDMERIYAYRALRFARNDKTQLPGFDGDAFVRNSRANERDVLELIAELETVREATVSMAEGFDHEAFSIVGIANGQPVSVAALLYHIAGHELHHVNLIRTRYLP